MKRYYADLHIHIGRTNAGRPVKITAARDLTFEKIARECAVRKGIDIAGIVDCGSPAVMEDIETLLAAGEMVPLTGGGLRYREATTVILGCELETVEDDGGVSHHISYFPNLDRLQVFVGFLRRLVTNLDLSSQRCRVSARELLRMADAAGGIFVPAHAFTPHKSPYGSCVRRLREMFGDSSAGFSRHNCLGTAGFSLPSGLSQLAALELGLSADSFLADRITELAPLTFLTNSDAHSLPKIAREYNMLWLEAPTYAEVLLALKRDAGRKVLANYGLDPRLGKYHRTFCLKCEQIAQTPPPVLACPLCGSDDIVKGVLDRITEIADYAEPHPPEHRPPYHYQVPLLFLPGLGPVAMGKLLNRFGTEMKVLHEADPGDLELVVGRKLAALILQARQGTLSLAPGGGGRYGKAIGSGTEGQLSMGL